MNYHRNCGAKSSFSFALNYIVNSIQTEIDEIVFHAEVAKFQNFLSQ